MISCFDLLSDNYGMVYGISNEYQLHCALRYSHYDSFSFSSDDYDDISVCGQINDLRLRLLKNIYCENKLTINDSIIFNGEIDAAGHTIYNLKIEVLTNSNSKGIFVENYGYIHNLTLSNCILELGNVNKWNTTAGIITPNNYWVIDNVSVSGKCIYRLNAVEKEKTISSIDAIYFY